MISLRKNQRQINFFLIDIIKFPCSFYWRSSYSDVQVCDNDQMCNKLKFARISTELGYIFDI